MLISACMPKAQARPVPARRMKGSRSRTQAQERADDDGAVERDDDDAEDEAVFLGRDGDDEVGMRVGQGPLHRALADADAEEAALLDGVGGVADLGAGVDLGGEEAVDAAGEVLGSVVGEPADAEHARADAAEQHHRRAGDEIHERPGGEDEAGLAEIGLQRQQDRVDDRRRREGIAPAGRAPDLVARRHEPGAEGDEAGLEELGRLHRDEAQREPARSRPCRNRCRRRAARGSARRRWRSRARRSGGAGAATASR